MGEGAHRRLDRPSLTLPLECLHRFATGEQALGGLIGRHFDQGPIELDAPLPRRARSIKGRDKTPGTPNFFLTG
jgi:hypothetical protein